jgi:hypothetical protein
MPGLSRDLFAWLDETRGRQGPYLFWFQKYTDRRTARVGDPPPSTRRR